MNTGDALKRAAEICGGIFPEIETERVAGGTKQTTKPKRAPAPQPCFKEPDGRLDREINGRLEQTEAEK